MFIDLHLLSISIAWVFRLMFLINTGVPQLVYSRRAQFDTRVDREITCTN